MKKFEVFTRTVPWYELTPSKAFLYQDKQTRLWFAIYALSKREELQGAAYDRYTAYYRLKNTAAQRGIFIPGLDVFEEYDILEKVASYRVSS